LHSIIISPHSSTAKITANTTVHFSTHHIDANVQNKTKWFSLKCSGIHKTKDSDTIFMHWPFLTVNLGDISSQTW